MRDKINNKKCSKVFWGFWNNRSENKSKTKQIAKANILEKRPGAVGFTSGPSQEKQQTVGEQITVG